MTAEEEQTEDENYIVSPDERLEQEKDPFKKGEKWWGYSIGEALLPPPDLHDPSVRQPIRRLLLRHSLNVCLPLLCRDDYPPAILGSAAAAGTPLLLTLSPPRESPKGQRTIVELPASRCGENASSGW